MSARSSLAVALLLAAAVPALAANEATSGAEERATRPLPFVSDDYAKALGDARARALPLFIEAWAPW